jgi:hypothetical protein
MLSIAEAKVGLEIVADVIGYGVFEGGDRRDISGGVEAIHFG